jgi:DNA-binding response OmpR family regulator
MKTPAERILLVESDAEIKELIVHQALLPLGYQVQSAENANEAINLAVQSTPDLVIVDLNLPGLSGKDLLVALNSQGLQVPVIVIAGKGQENNVIQAFRLGGTDYLLWPTREAEVVSAVERALKQVRERHARERLDKQLKDTNTELQHRVRELTTIFSIGKAVVSITDQRVLFDKIVEGMVYAAEAEHGFLLIRDEKSRTFILTAQYNLPETWSSRKGKPLDDGVSSLVALSGETLAIHGEPLLRFKLASLGKSAIVVPIKVKGEVIGILVAVRKENRPFESTMQSLLGALADYASVSLVNARLFRALQESLDSSKANEKKKVEQLQNLHHEMQPLLQSITYPIELLLANKIGNLTVEQRQALLSAQNSLQQAMKLIESNGVSQASTNPTKSDG